MLEQQQQQKIQEFVNVILHIDHVVITFIFYSLFNPVVMIFGTLLWHQKDN